MDPLIVIGGGIAGVTCARVLSLDNSSCSVILVSASSTVKNVANLKTIGRGIDIFDVIEQNSSQLTSSNLQIIINKCVRLDSANSQIEIDDGSLLKYKKLCICTGAKPKIIKVDDQAARQYIKCIRDTHTAKSFQTILANSKKIMVVGNGGIAVELVHEVENVEVIWVIRDDSIGATFFDAGAAKFFSEFSSQNEKKSELVSKRHHFSTTVNDPKNRNKDFGVALGPDWHQNLSLIGKKETEKNVIIEKKCEILKVYSAFKNIPNDKLGQNSIENHWNIYVELTNGKIHGCDALICATGVKPNTKVFRTSSNCFSIGFDGGFLVDREMKTSISNVYAAGDCCTAGWKHADHWFQMRLWTQARQMGYYAAKCIQAHLNNASPEIYFNFDVFTHVTRFFGCRVILLGSYNGQKITTTNYKIFCRVIPNKEYVKVIMTQNYRMVGAILIGETNVEETFEFLIYNQIDLSRFGDNILDDQIDIEDFFD